MFAMEDIDECRQMLRAVLAGQLALLVVMTTMGLRVYNAVMAHRKGEDKDKKASGDDKDGGK